MKEVTHNWLPGMLVFPALCIQMGTLKYSVTIASSVVSWRQGKGPSFVPDVI